MRRDRRFGSLGIRRACARGSRSPAAQSAPAYVFPLDTWTGAYAAVSMRKLREAYSGDCLTARRASDSATQGIGFVSNLVDTAALDTFRAGGEASVLEWLDQSINTKSFTADTLGTAQEPALTNGAGALETTAGAPLAARFDGSASLRIENDSAASASAPLYVFAVIHIQSLAAAQTLLDIELSRRVVDLSSGSGGTPTQVFNGSAFVTAPALSTGYHTVTWQCVGGAPINVLLDGVSTGAGTGNYTNGAITAGERISISSNSAVGLPASKSLTAGTKLVEMLVYHSDVSASVSAIVADQRAYWGTP